MVGLRGRLRTRRRCGGVGRCRRRGGVAVSPRHLACVGSRRWEGAAHAGSGMAVVPVGVDVEVLLVAGFGVVEGVLPGVVDGGDDGGPASGGEHVGERFGHVLGEGEFACADEECGSVGRADVVALAVVLGGVVVFEEVGDELRRGHFARVVGDGHDFGVTRAARADFSVGGERRVAAHVADCGGYDAGGFPKHFLGSPKAAHAHVETRRAGPRADERRPEHAVRFQEGEGIVVAAR